MSCRLQSWMLSSRPSNQYQLASRTTPFTAYSVAHTQTASSRISARTTLSTTTTTNASTAPTSTNSYTSNRIDSQ